MFCHQCIHCYDYNLTIAYNRQYVLWYQIISCLTFSWRRVISHRNQSIGVYMIGISVMKELNHFISLLSFYTPWKHKKNFWFSCVFSGYRKRPITRNGLQTALIDTCESLLFKISNNKGSTKTNNHCKSIFERISPNSK